MTYETRDIQFSYNRFTECRKLFVQKNELLSFDYLRETIFRTSTRNALSFRNTVKRPLFGEQFKGIIGYCCIGEGEGPHTFRCLAWWHKAHDRDVDPNGVYHRNDPTDPESKTWGPCEAVSPERVLKFFPEYRGDANV
jgi:hypothetical protein